MATPTPAQIRGARGMLGLSQAELSRLSSVSLPRIIAVESGGNCLQSTATAITSALEREGARFTPDGAVRIVPKTGKWIIPAGQHPSPENVRFAMELVNTSRAMKGLPLFTLEDE